MTTNMENKNVGKLVVLTDETFKDFISQSKVPVLVDFWAEWCGPCRMIAPILEDLAHELHGRAVLAKVNVDENATLASTFKIKSIPALLVFKNTEIVETIIGAVPRKVILDKLSKHL